MTRWQHPQRLRQRRAREALLSRRERAPIRPASCALVPRPGPRLCRVRDARAACSCLRSSPGPTIRSSRGRSASTASRSPATAACSRTAARVPPCRRPRRRARASLRANHGLIKAVVVEHGTLPADDSDLELKPAPRASARIDLDALLAGRRGRSRPATASLQPSGWAMPWRAATFTPRSIIPYASARIYDRYYHSWIGTAAETSAQCRAGRCQLRIDSDRILGL